VAWLGNTPNIALRHYLMTTEEHFRQAVGEPVSPPSTAPKKRGA
jgi:hypothetical protein